MSDDLSRRLVDAIHGAYGAHPGRRAAHAKGACVGGVFTGAPDFAASFCRAPQFAGAPVPVSVRFSNGSGDPGAPDTRLDGRGMAVKFHLEDGGETDMVGLSQPVFFVRDTESFMEMVALRRVDPETGRMDRSKIEEWVGRHPEAAGAFLFLMTTPAPASYFDLTYFGIHAFRLVSPSGAGVFARYRWVPEAPAAALTSEERKAKGPDYLQEELAARNGSGAFRLEWVLAGPDDDVNDPTVMWPDDRQVVAGGRLVLSSFRGGDCEEMVFDPMRLADGVEPSDDQILLARPGAYSVSIEERLG